MHHLIRLIPVVALALAFAIHPVAAQSSADLTVTMAPSQKHLRFQESMTVTITVTNLGPDPATGVRLSTGESDSINTGAIVCPDGTVHEFGGTCEIGFLGAGESVTATWTVSACCQCCPKRLGVISASVSGDAVTMDPNPDNNRARVETRFVGKFPF
jgi:uncharacterized repeat protein (TIGR01451 family)